MNSLKISVVLTAYKGEKYIEEQLLSITKQLKPEDEVIVSDDFPDGETQNCIKNLQKEDKRILYFEGPGKGVIKNFEFGISKTRGDLIFLCDQDDVWMPDKVTKVSDEIENGAYLVLHDASICDEKLEIISGSYFQAHGLKTGIISNFMKNSYVGCCMAFRSEIKKFILPFPKKIPMHDQWIGILCERNVKVKFIYEPLILYRRHGDNVTGQKTSVFQKLKWRMELLLALLTCKHFLFGNSAGLKDNGRD